MEASYRGPATCCLGDRSSCPLNNWRRSGAKFTTGARQVGSLRWSEPSAGAADDDNNNKSYSNNRHLDEGNRCRPSEGRLRIRGRQVREEAAAAGGRRS